MSDKPGWILLYKKMLDWEWYQDVPVKTLFLHCLLKANYTDTKWRGEEVERGSLITSINNLASETGLTIQEVRTALKKLEDTGEINKRTTNRYSYISVTYYDEYQFTNKQLTNKQQTTNKQATNNQQQFKEVKEVKEYEEIEKSPSIRFQGIHEDVEEQPFSRLSPDESKKVVELDEDFGQETVDKAWRYFLDNKSQFITDRAGSKTVGWFRHCFDDVFAAMSNSGQLDNMTSKQRQLIEEAREKYGF